VSAASPATRDPLADLETVGKLDADRLCGRCLHQLDGQVTRRDPRLGITVVRCPECGTFAAVTEHPVTSRWARRFLAIVGAAVLAGSLVAFLANASILGTIQYAIAEEIAGGAFLGPLRAAAGAESQDWYAVEAFRTQFASDAALRARIGAEPAARAAARSQLLFSVSVPLLIASAFGAAFWTALTIHRRIWVPIAIVVAILLLAWLGARIGFSLEAGIRIGGTPFRDLAAAAYGPEWLAYVGLGCLATSLVTIALGRLAIPPFARAILPRKILAGLATVWEGAGFDPPSRR
jgi:hypothetical protein